MRDELKNPVVYIFWILGLALLIGSVFLYRNVSARAGWPKVAAQVLSSEVVGTVKGSGMTGEVEVLTEGGDTHTLTLSWSSSSTSFLERALEVAPAGETILMPVNPEDEADLRLPVGPHDYALPFILAAAGLLFIFIPVGVVALSRRKDAVRLTGWTFVLCGMVFMAIGATLAAGKARVVSSWPTTEAVIGDSEIRRRPGSYTRGRTSSNYGIDLTVSYEVKGELVESSFRAEEHSSSDPAQLRPLLKGPLAVGETVTVQYDPDSPRVATLKKDWSLKTFSMALLAALAGVLTSLLGWAVVRFL